MFNALTRGSSRPGIERHDGSPHRVVDVPDNAWTSFGTCSRPKKDHLRQGQTTTTSPGLDGQAPAKSASPARCSNQLTQMEGFPRGTLLRRRERFPTLGQCGPRREMLAMDSEFVRNDLVAVERKLDAWADERPQRRRARQGPLDRVIALFKRFTGAQRRTSAPRG
jgi:hypothetical protein